MAKIRYTIRLYRLHDLDLITFVETHEFNIISAIYSSLTAFAKGELFVIEIPPRREIQLPKLSRVYTKALVLDTEIDEEAIELLNKVGQGYRNNFLKNLLRLYLCNPLSEEFFKNIKRGKNDEVLYETPQLEIDERTELFNEKFKIFKTGKKIVKAGRIRRRNVDVETQAEPTKKQVKPKETPLNNKTKNEEPNNKSNTEHKVQNEILNDGKNINDIDEFNDLDEINNMNEDENAISKTNDDDNISSEEADEITALFEGIL